MKSKLLKSVYSIANLENSWKVIQRNGRYSNSDEVRKEIERFSLDPSKNLRSIQTRLARDKFVFAPSKGVPVPKVSSTGAKTGKHRPLVLAPLESRIVQRALLNVLTDLSPLKPFSNTPFSFGGMRKPSGAHGQDVETTLSAVPAAIQTALTQIGAGSHYIVTADINSFFTKIPRSLVRSIISSAVSDEGVMALYDEAIKVELRNMAALRDLGDLFPSHEIGVAQGNSLSPLLGNIVLADFDAKMNAGDCMCIRYIDDILILAPTKKAANARLKLATDLLGELGMSLAAEKSHSEGQPVSDGFDFLGINIVPGLIRPNKKAHDRFLSGVRNLLEDSTKAILAVKYGNELDPRLAVIATLKKLNGMIDGWGKHYWFCNDDALFQAIEVKVIGLVDAYLGMYSNIRASLPNARQHLPLGLNSLVGMTKAPFLYPKG